MCHNRIRNQKNEKYKKGNAKTSSDDNFLFYAFGD